MKFFKISTMTSFVHSIPVENKDFVLYQINDFWHWESQGDRFGNDYCSEDGFESRADCVADALGWLTAEEEAIAEGEEFAAASVGVYAELPENSPYQHGIHFAMYREGNGADIHWQGLCQETDEGKYWWGKSDFAHLSSSEGFANPQYALADCLFSLHIERGYSVDESVELIYELSLPIDSQSVDSGGDEDE